MLSRKIPKLKLGLKCKGNPGENDKKLRTNTDSKSCKSYNFSISKVNKFGKYALSGIPVLSIFVLLGMFCYSLMIPSNSDRLFGWLSGIGSEEAYAETYTTASGESSVSLTIGGAGEAEQVVAGRGVVAYRSHTLRVQANTVKDYGLTISGPANMTAPSGGTTIAGVANKTGTEMGSSTTYDNTWGYGWGATSTSDANLTYRTLSTTGTNLLTVNGTSDKPALSNRAVDFTRKLVFAVKFGEEAVAGRYYANVTLSLTATPATLTTYSVTYDCKSGTGCPANYSESLYDESKSYTIPTTSTNNPTRAGYNFLGYSTSSTATSANSSYAPGKTITLTQASPTRTLYAVWQLKSTTYTLTLNANSGTGGPGSQTCTATGTATSCSITISSTKPTRSGYTFQGWNTNSSGNGSTTYQPGGSITLSSNTTLWAKWEAVATSSFPSTLTTMQGMTSSICAAASIGATKTLTDSRDSSTYTIRKHEDSKCWMTQNLRLTGSRTLTSSDSNVSSSFALPASNISSFTKDQNVNSVYYGGNTSYGAYYSWYAATAGTMGTSASVCPKGWKLPTQNDYSNLITAVNAGTEAAASTIFQNSPYLFTNAGYVSGGSLSDSGTTGDCWTSTTNGSRAYQFRVHPTYISITNNSNYYRGLSIRCVAYSS